MKKLKYISDKYGIWDDYFTKGKVYLQIEGTTLETWAKVKCDNGDVKVVLLEFFEDVTDEVDNRFNQLFWAAVTLLSYLSIMAGACYIFLLILKLFK